MSCGALIHKASYRAIYEANGISASKSILTESFGVVRLPGVPPCAPTMNVFEALTVNEGPFMSALAGARINSRHYYAMMNVDPNTGSAPIGIPYDDAAFTLIADAPAWNAI
jgi:hypothetical protein